MDQLRWADLTLNENHLSPRFLIHNSPREADMARVIYERFFLYAHRIEHCQPGRGDVLIHPRHNA